MARSFTAASTQYLEHAAAVATAVPLSIHFWFFPTATAADYSGPGIFNNGTTLDMFGIQIRGATQTLRAQQSSSAVSGNATTTATWTQNAWNAGGGVFALNNLRFVYLNGGNKVQNTTNIATPVGLNRTVIGRRSISTPAQYMEGRLAHVAMWNTGLTDIDMAVLGMGVDPRYIQPAFLIGYWPVWGLHSPEIDLTPFGRTMTVNNAPPLANDAPVAPFNLRRWGGRQSVPQVSAHRRLLMGAGR